MLVDGSAPPQAFSGVGEAYLDGAPLLVLLLDPDESRPLLDLEEEGLPLLDSASTAVSRVLCKQTFSQMSPSTLVAAAAAARDGHPGPVAVRLTRAAVEDWPEPHHLVLNAPHLPGQTTTTSLDGHASSSITEHAQIVASALMNGTQGVT